jgi:hypothetical protein
VQEITSIAELREAIEILEADQKVKGQALKEQFQLTYESLKPINLLNSTLKEIASSPILLDNILGTAMGIVSGFLSKKLVVGTSGNIIRKLLGSLLQYGVTNVVAQHPETLRSIGRFIIQLFSPPKEIHDKP